MVLVSTIRDNLYKRLGITSPSQRETDRVEEALYAGIARAVADGIPGLAHSLITAETYGQSSDAVAAGGHSANTATITLDAIPTGTRAGDLLKIGSDIYTVFSISGSAIDVGAPIKNQIADATTVTVIHRTVELPNTGPVLRVFDLTNDHALAHEPSGFARYGFNQGTPKGYEITYDRDNSELVVGLWPAPDNATRLAVVQSFAWDSLTTGTDLPFPASALEAIMERAIACWRSWQVGGVSPAELEASRQSVKDAETGLNHGSTQPIVRDSLRGRGRRH